MTVTSASPNTYFGFKKTKGDATGVQGMLSVPASYRVLHFAEAADYDTDWNVANPTHPTLYVHSATTPATDYISLDHDATDGTINVASGNLKLAIGGTDEVVLTADALSPATSDGSALGTTALMWGDLFLASAGVINFNNGNVTMTHAAGLLTIAGADVGIGATATANQTLTVTDATLAATGRILKLSATVAAAAFTDGYGACEVDVTLSGSPTDHSAASSSWINITGGTVPAGTYICARNDGIYEEAAATVTNAKIIFGARMQYIFSDTDSLRFPFSVNTNNAAITALIDVNNHSDLNVTAGAHSSAVTGSLPFCRNAAGEIKYIRVYDTAA